MINEMVVKASLFQILDTAIKNNIKKNGYMRIIIRKDPYTDTRNYVPLLFEVSATTTLTYSDEEVTTILKQGHLYQSEILGINVASHILEKAGG